MKKYILTAISIAMMFTLSGCGNKVLAVQHAPYLEDSGLVTTTVSINMRDGRSILRSSDAQDSGIAALERIARNVLDSNNSYFAIYKPKNLSNFEGSTITTFEEFEKACIDSGFTAAVSMFDAFGIGKNACGLANPRNQNRSSVSYVKYKTKPDDVLTWDAKKLLEVLTEKELIVPNDVGWELSVKSPVKSDL